MNAPHTPDLSPEDIMGSSGPIEPNAEAREGARQIRHLYVALRKEGFTEIQTLQLLGLMMASGNGKES